MRKCLRHRRCGRTLTNWVSGLVLWMMFSALAAGGPQLSLKNLDGEWHSIDEFVGRGQWVLVNIWGPRCPPCVEEMPELGSFHDRHSGAGAMVLGIAIDFPSFGYAVATDVRQFLDDYLIDFPVLLADHTVFARLTDGQQLRAVPTSLLYRPDGVLAVVHTGTLTQLQLEQYLARQDARFR